MSGSLEFPVIMEQQTPDFRDDLSRLTPEDRTRVATILRRSGELLRSNPRGFFAKASRPQLIQLKNGLTPSLCSVAAGRDIRLIMAVDDDPVFHQTLVTLFRAVHHDELGRAYRAVADRLYRNQIKSNGGHR